MNKCEGVLYVSKPVKCLEEVLRLLDMFPIV